jgi:hypothetical protein
MDKKKRTDVYKKRYEPKTEVLEIPVQDGRNIDCELEDCRWNKDCKCMALALDIKKGEGNEPICETYSSDSSDTEKTDDVEEKENDTNNEDDDEGDKAIREKAIKEIDENNGGMSTQTKPVEVVNYYRRTNRPIS